MIPTAAAVAMMVFYGAVCFVAGVVAGVLGYWAVSAVHHLFKTGRFR